MGDARETRIREAHRAMAEALGPVDGRSAVELARHWAAAEQALEFSACVRDAVAEAHRSEEYAAEAELLEQLLAWWSAPGVAEAIGEPRTAIVLAAARAHRLAGQPHACVDRCRDLVTGSHPAGVAVAAQVELAAALTETADATAAVEVARALALVGSLPDTPDAARCVAFAAGLALSYPTPHGLAVAQDAARRAQAHGLRDVAARASNTLPASRRGSTRRRRWRL